MSANGDTLEHLSTWLRTESPTHAPAGVNRMMDLVAAEVADAPVAVERIPGRAGLGDVLVLRAGPQTSEPAVLVMSHLDTVHPLGTADHDLPVRLEGDRLYGPGCYDMKGGAYLALEAFKAVARSGGARRPLVYLMTPDEEIGSPTTRAMIEDLARNAAFALVTEPARDGGKVVTGRKGVGRFEVHVEGRPAHSGSRHADGRSAIREAARQILAIEEMTDYARGVTTTVGMISGGTAANVIPQHCRFAVDLRVVNVADGERHGAAILGLKAHDPDVKLDRHRRHEPAALREIGGRRQALRARPQPCRASSASSSARCRSPAAARTATSPRRSACRRSTASASTATAPTRCTNTASSPRSSRGGS